MVGTLQTESVARSTGGHIEALPALNYAKSVTDQSRGWFCVSGGRRRVGLNGAAPTD
jgi:hypothetical protein